MALRIIRLGTPRLANEGLRLGTVRRPPRGVPKADFARLDYYDLWLPQLAPSAELMKQGQAASDERSWGTFKRQFRAAMGDADAARLLDFIAALSQQTNLALGCYCELEAHCHRSVLRELLEERGARWAE